MRTKTETEIENKAAAGEAEEDTAALNLEGYQTPAGRCKTAAAQLLGKFGFHCGMLAVCHGSEKPEPGSELAIEQEDAIQSWKLAKQQLEDLARGVEAAERHACVSSLDKAHAMTGEDPATSFWWILRWLPDPAEVWRQWCIRNGRPDEAEIVDCPAFYRQQREVFHALASLCNWEAAEDEYPCEDGGFFGKKDRISKTERMGLAAVMQQLGIAGAQFLREYFGPLASPVSAANARDAAHRERILRERDMAIEFLNAPLATVLRKLPDLRDIIGEPDAPEVCWRPLPA